MSRLPTPVPHPEPHVMIGTPAYGGMVHMNFVHTLLQLKAAGIRFGLHTLGNESLITRARNSLIAIFHQRTEYTHLLFLDADMALPPTGLQAMLAQGQDVIGAPVALKGRNAKGGRIFNINNVIGERGELLLATRIGTAVLMLSRKAVTALVDDAERHGRVYQRMTTVQGDLGPPLHYDVFQVGVHNGVYLSEDYWVCDVLRRLSFDICVLPEVLTQHHGTVAV